ARGGQQDHDHRWRARRTDQEQQSCWSAQRAQGPTDRLRRRRSANRGRQAGERGLSCGGRQGAGNPQSAIRCVGSEPENDHQRQVGVAGQTGDHPDAIAHVALPELERLVDVMARLRHECPWDAQQTHRSLVQYLVEEAAETVEAIEIGDQDHIREELGDLLLQVIFHAEIASEQAEGFTVEDVARGIADKLISRHPYVFTTAAVPADLHYTWEQRKAVEKGRTSALQGIPDQLSALARANKIISRARSRRVAVALPDDPTTAEEVGSQILVLAARAQASGIDPDQALRDAARGLESRIHAAE